MLDLILQIEKSRNQNCRFRNNRAKIQKLMKWRTKIAIKQKKLAERYELNSTHTYI